MGVLKKYIAQSNIEGARLWLDNRGNNANGRPFQGNDNAEGVYYNGPKCPKWKDWNGTEYSYINVIMYANNGNFSYDYYRLNNLKSFSHLTGYASNEEIGDFNKYDYNAEAVIPTATEMSYVFNESVMKSMATVTLTNPDYDIYRANTNPVWAIDTYYEKINNEYFILTEEPDNWVNNYSSYYIKIEPANVTIKCIKFSRQIWQNTDAQYGNNNYVNVKALVYAYYLDTPITLEPGDIETITITFTPTED